MEAATRLPFSQVRTQGDRLWIDGLVVDDARAVKLAHEREDAGEDLGRASRDFRRRAERAVRDWQSDVLDMVRGVPQSYFVDQFAADGIMLEGIAGPPDYLAMAAPFAGDRHRELMLRYR